jgi:CheY-like chemotaxis protein
VRNQIVEWRRAVPTIFVVDDDPLILDVLGRILAVSFTVVPFSAAQEAVGRLAEGPDLLLCDYHLPFKDGLEIACEAKKVSPNTRVVILSAGLEDDRVRRSLKDGIIDLFLSKPFECRALVRQVSDLLARPPAAS